MSGAPLPLSSDAQASLQQAVEDFEQLDISDDSFERYYDIDASADFIKSNGFQNVSGIYNLEQIVSISFSSISRSLSNSQIL